MEKLSFYCYVCITVFLHGRLLEIPPIKHQHPYRYALVL